MAEKYSKNYVFFFIVIAIIVLMAIFWYAFNKPAMTAIGDNQTPYICKEGQNCSLQSTPDSSKENLTAAQKKMSTDLLQLIGVLGLPSGMTRDAFEQQMKQARQLKWVDENGATTNDTRTGQKLVYVYIKTREKSDPNVVSPYVWNISNSDPTNAIIVAWVEPENLLKLASLESVQSIRTVTPPTTD